MLFLLAACTGGPEVEPLAGTVTAESGEVAELVSATAFGVMSGGRAAFLVSPNPDSDCEDAADFLGSVDEDFNPEVVSGEGVCNLYARVDEFTGGELTLTDADGLATIALNCAMDEGEWAYEERTYDGYFYSGPYWVGSPESYTLTLTGESEQDLTLTLSMDTYTGRFPYDEENPEADAASGAVAGTVTAEWCSDMGATLN